MRSLVCVIGILVLACAMSSSPTTVVPLRPLWPHAGACVLYACTRAVRSLYANRFRMHLFASDPVNETLLVEAQLCGRPTIFLIDTGYAGPPVISMSYLAVHDTNCSDIKLRYNRIIRELERGVSNTEQHAAINQLIHSHSCIAYTSGCTMRLMSIGDIQEQQADMLLCPPILMRTAATGEYAAPKNRVVDADVLVSNPLPHSIHILTCDYLLHASPSLLDIGQGCIQLRMNDGLMVHRARMKMFPE